jgi:mRNA interferase MazF
MTVAYAFKPIPKKMPLLFRSVIIAPMTSASKDYPTRLSGKLKKKQGQIVLDRIRTINKIRLIKKLGTIDPKAKLEVISILQRMFAF